MNKHIKARHEKYADKNNLMINMDPEIAEALGKSTQISCKLIIEYDCIVLC